MASIDNEYEGTDWVKLTSEQARRKSVKSEVSVGFVSDKYTNFEELSFADLGMSLDCQAVPSWCPPGDGFSFPLGK